MHAAENGHEDVVKASATRTLCHPSHTESLSLPLPCMQVCTDLIRLSRERRHDTADELIEIYGSTEAPEVMPEHRHCLRAYMHTPGSTEAPGMTCRVSALTYWGRQLSCCVWCRVTLWAGGAPPHSAPPARCPCSDHKRARETPAEHLYSLTLLHPLLLCAAA